jgi:GH24 family phage-related lysozyme (muramidase)
VFPKASLSKEKLENEDAINVNSQTYTSTVNSRNTTITVTVNQLTSLASPVYNSRLSTEE